MMDDCTLALLGDRAAQERITKRGELLPCPFCGSTEISTYVSSERDKYDWMTSHSYVYPYCKKCGSSGPKVPLIGKGSPLDTWNTRAPILSAEEMEMLEGLE